MKSITRRILPLMVWKFDATWHNDRFGSQIDPGEILKGCKNRIQKLCYSYYYYNCVIHIIIIITIRSFNFEIIPFHRYYE